MRKELFHPIVRELDARRFGGLRRGLLVKDAFEVVDSLRCFNCLKDRPQECSVNFLRVFRQILLDCRLADDSFRDQRACTKLLTERQDPTLHILPPQNLLILAEYVL